MPKRSDPSAAAPHGRVCSLCFACSECERLLTGVEWHGNAHLCGYDECEYVELMLSGHATPQDASLFWHDETLVRTLTTRDTLRKRTP